MHVRPFQAFAAVFLASAAFAIPQPPHPTLMQPPTRPLTLDELKDYLKNTDYDDKTLFERYWGDLEMADLLDYPPRNTDPSAKKDDSSAEKGDLSMPDVLADTKFGPALDSPFKWIETKSVNDHVGACKSGVENSFNTTSDSSPTVEDCLCVYHYMGHQHGYFKVKANKQPDTYQAIAQCGGCQLSIYTNQAWPALKVGDGDLTKAIGIALVNYNVTYPDGVSRVSASGHMSCPGSWWATKLVAGGKTVFWSLDSVPEELDA